MVTRPPSTLTVLSHLLGSRWVSRSAQAPWSSRPSDVNPRRRMRMSTSLSKSMFSLEYVEC
jgi:hypothetical protein